MNKAEKQELLSELKKFYKELRSYDNRQHRSRKVKLSEAQIRSLNALRLKLQRDYGRLANTISQYGGDAYVTILGRDYEVFGCALGSLDMHHGEFRALDGAISMVNKAIGKLESTTLADTQLQKVKITEPPKGFIAHEGMTGALNKLKEFLDALGISYLIAEIEPSDGRLVEGQVDWTQGQADFALILATRGKVINKATKAPQMGTNVADELGRARAIFKNRTILLLEKGVEAHTNISGIVHERFTPQSMDKAFTKIVNELKNWGFLRVGKVEE